MSQSLALDSSNQQIKRSKMAIDRFMDVNFSPQKFREMVFQLLFSIDANQEPEVGLIPFLMRELSVSKKQVKAAYLKAVAIWNHRERFDTILRMTSEEYAVERIKTIEKNVLRVALYELLIEKELSKKILFSEAYRLARKFSSEEGASFVHAILDSLTLEEIEHEPTLPLSREIPTE